MEFLIFKAVEYLVAVALATVLETISPSSPPDPPPAPAPIVVVESAEIIEP
jgi:hypothetical protein